MRTSGWPGFLLWALVGGLYALAYLAMMSIGIFILVVAIIATIIAARTLRAWPELLGLAVGPPAAMMWMAARVWNLPRCGPGEGELVSASASGSLSVQSGTYSQTVHLGCTQWDVSFLMWGAVALGTATVVAYVAARYRMRANSPSSLGGSEGSTEGR